MWNCEFVNLLYMYDGVFTVVASSTAVSDPTDARRLGHASIGLSVAGIVVSVIVVIVVVAVIVSRPTCPHVYGRTCYNHYDYVGYGYCGGVRVYGNYGYCYYN